MRTSLRRQLTRCIGVVVLTSPASEVLAQRGAPGSPRFLRDAQQRVTGVVFDSLQQVPLREAVVQLVEDRDRQRSRTVYSDSSGRFAIEDVAPGAYLLGFFHPRLDSLLIAVPPRRLVVTAAAPPPVTLAIPPISALRSALCGEDAPGGDRGVLLGRVRDLSSRPLGGDQGRSRVQVSWNEVVLGRNASAAVPPSRQAWPDAHGAYVLCGVPVDIPLQLLAWSDVDSTDLLDMNVPVSGIGIQDLVLDVASAPSQEQPVRITGHILRADSTPISAAGVAIRGERSQATTDATGAFVLDAMRLGLQTLEIRAMGFEPRRVTVQIGARESPPITVNLRAISNTLATVRITAAKSLAGFYGRRQSNKLGIFIDEDAIARRDPMFVADIVRSVHGVRVRPSGSFSDVISSGEAGCPMNVFIDGRLIPMRTQDLDAYVSADEIRAVEIYIRHAEIPREFLSPPPCGAMLIWRGVRQPVRK